MRPIKVHNKVAVHYLVRNEPNSWETSGKNNAGRGKGHTHFSHSPSMPPCRDQTCKFKNTAGTFLCPKLWS